MLILRCEIKSAGAHASARSSAVGFVHCVSAPSVEGIVKWHGRFELRVPFNDHRELLMDILKYGGDVGVRGPEFLGAAVKGQMERMREMYRVK